MSPHSTDQRYFERQIVYARPIIIFLAILALFEQPPSAQLRRSVSFLVAYLILALLVARLERALRSRAWHLPLACDLLALGFFLYLSPSSVPVWFPYLFICYAAGIRWGLDGALPLAGLLSLGLVLSTVGTGEVRLMRVVGWLAITGGTFAGGAGLAFLGDLSRRFARENAFFSRISSTMNVEQGLAESLRLLLEELAMAFSVEEAMLLYRDVDLERIFLWRLRTGESERLVPDTLPLSRTDGFLLDDLDATLCWNSLVGAGSGFGWDRRDGRPLKNLPRIPGPTQTEMKIRSLMTVAFDQAGAPVGRFFLLNGRKGHKPFRKADLAWLERISRHIGP